MIDTIRLQWQGVRIPPDFYDRLVAEYETPSITRRFYDKDLPWEGTQFTDEVLGEVGTKSNRTGNYLWIERSLPKFMYGDNCRMLSYEEAREGLDVLVKAVYQKFSDIVCFSYSPSPGVVIKDLPTMCVCKRVDFCYQRHVPSSGEVFAHIARCLKNRKVALRLTGVEVHQSKLEHARFYDKGLESGDERYLDVVRHEEQLRGPKAAYFVHPPGAFIRLDEAREQMNRRFKDWPTTEVESYGFETLFEEERVRGLAAGLLALHPEYDQLAKRHLPNGTYYKLRNLALDAQRRVSKLDLRLPDDAWAQSMVL